MDDKAIKIIEDVEGVERACGFYSINNITVSDQPTKLKAFLGIDPETYLNYSDLTVNDQNPQEALDKLASGRNILLGSKFASRIGVTEGDEVTFTLNQKQVTYTVVGILDIMEQDGSIALVSNKLLVKDTDMSSYSGIYITASEGEKPNEVLENVRNTFPNEVSSGGTMAEHQEHILKETGGIFKMMNSMSMLCMLIGILGILNNLTICFIQRRRSLAVLRSVGLGKKQMVQMIFIESFFSGIIGGAIGVFGGWVTIYIALFLTKALIATIPMHYSVNTLIFTGISGLLVTLLASVHLASNALKLNVVNAIKYE